MVNAFRTLRTRALPATTRANTLYFVQPSVGDPATLFMVGFDGVAVAVIEPDGYDDPGDIAAVFASA